MLNYFLRYPLLISFLTCLLISNHSWSQEFLPKLDQFKSLQKDSDNFYFKETVSDINKAIKIDTLNSQSYFYKAFVLLKCDSVKSAIDNINKSIALNDTNKYSVYFLGEIYMRLGKTREADSLFNRAINIDKKYYEPYFGLANLQMMKNSYWKADSLYSKVIELNPGFSMAYFNLAITNLVSDRDNALKSINKCIELTPSF